MIYDIKKKRNLFVLKLNGIVQRILIAHSIHASKLEARPFFFLNLKGHHHKRSIKPFPAA